MKKIAAILLIVILFFNWYGYRIVTSLLVEKADKLLETRLDNNDYEESQLIEVRVALNVPYQNNQSEFERHYGEMEVDGKFYTYVKRKIENGYLVLKCIPNSSKQQIKEAGNDFFKMANGIDQDHSKKSDGNGNNSLAKNFWSEYDGHENEFSLESLQLANNQTFPRNTTTLIDICYPTAGQPPEQVI